MVVIGAGGSVGVGLGVAVATCAGIVMAGVAVLWTLAARCGYCRL
jgi:hypothetical protein